MHQMLSVEPRLSLEIIVKET
jgi:hypothetical protein